MSERHAFRAYWLDYNEGIFFVTICCKEMKHLFGKIIDGIMYKNELGNIVNNKILDLVNHYTELELHNHIVMPNHIHILIQLLPVGTRPVASTCQTQAQVVQLHPNASTYQNTGCLKPPRHDRPRDHSHFNSRLAVIIGGLKAAVTREWRKLQKGELKREDIYTSEYENYPFEGWTRQVASL